MNIVCKWCAACVFKFVQSYIVGQEIGDILAVAVESVVAELCIYKTAVLPSYYFFFAHCKRSYSVVNAMQRQNALYCLPLQYPYCGSWVSTARYSKRFCSVVAVRLRSCKRICERKGINASRKKFACVSLIVFSQAVTHLSNVAKLVLQSFMS